MSDQSVVLPQASGAPGAIVTGGGHGHHGYHRERGLEGKDATFFVLQGQRDLTRDVLENKAEAVEARLSAQLKTVECHLSMLSEIKESKAERKSEIAGLEKLIIQESKATQDMLRDREIRDLRDRLNCMAPVCLPAAR